MAIAFDNHSFAEGLSSVTNTPHTIAGSNTILFVAVGTTTNTQPSTVNYASNAMTLITSQVGGSGRTVWLYFQVAPTTGTNNITVIASGIYAVAGLSFTGAKQSGIPDASNTGTSTSGTVMTASVTSIVDNCWTVMAVIGDGSGNTVTAGTNWTIHDALDANVGFGESAGVIHPAGLFSQTANFSTGQSKAAVIASFAPATAQVSSHLLSSTGVGG